MIDPTGHEVFFNPDEPEIEEESEEQYVDEEDESEDGYIPDEDEPDWDAIRDMRRDDKEFFDSLPEEPYWDEE